MTVFVGGTVDADSLTSRLAAGLVRVAVTTQADSIPPDEDPKVERTVAQQQMLLLLARRAETYRLTELASLLGMTVRVAVSTSGALAREGLVQMRPSPSYAPDEVRIFLTAKGRAAVPDLANWADALLGEVENLDEAAQEKVLDLVTDQIAALQRAGRIPVTRICLTCRYFDGYAHPGTNLPHHCHLVDAPFGYRELRLRCPEQTPPAN
jgi:DNA-binding MarR family transcriptional regulator